MISGFRDTLKTILLKYGIDSGAIGTVWAVGDTMWKLVNALGFRVEAGISHPTYDYVILSEKRSTLENILLALTRLNVGGIVIFRHFQNTSAIEITEGLGYQMTTFAYNNGFLGVIVAKETR